MKAVLIDDEKLAIDDLEQQLLKIADYHIVGKFTDPVIGKRVIENNDVDIVFLDILLPGFNGLKLAEQLLERKPELIIVFVTAYNHFAVKAFELNAFDYILKPVRQERLVKTTQRAKQRKMGLCPDSLRRTEILQLNLFSHITISDESGGILPLHWRTADIQQLFLYLLQHRGQVVGKSELIDLLWPEFELKRAYARLYTGVYHIRQLLEPFGDHFAIISSSEGYLLALKDIRLDVDQFERFVQSETPLSRDTIEQYEQAMSLFTGEYLQEYNYAWAENERRRLQAMWIRTVSRMADWYYSNHHLDKAVSHCLSICHKYPLEEKAWFTLMKLLAEAGDRASVLHYFNQLRAMLKEKFNTQPSPAITEWYQAWKNQSKPLISSGNS